MMQRPFLGSGIIGVFSIAVFLVLTTVFPSKAPSMMEGFSVPIIAFEFVQTPQEVHQLFGLSASAARDEMVAAMDRGNRLDFIYLCLYGSFLMTFSLKTAAVTGKKRYAAGAVLAAAALVADAMENVQLLTITSNIDAGDFGRALFYLHYFTWIKWGGIVAVFLLLAPYFFSGGGFSKTIALAGTACAVLAVLSYLHRSSLNEIFAFAVGVVFLLMIVYAFLYREEGREGT